MKMSGIYAFNGLFLGLHSPPITVKLLKCTNSILVIYIFPENCVFQILNDKIFLFCILTIF